jgi:membrane protease YdiL (CAAX protease family)
VKRCPQCHEKLQDTAIRCKFCRRPLSAEVKNKLTMEGAYPPWKSEEVFGVILGVFFLTFIAGFVFKLSLVVLSFPFEGVRTFLAKLGDGETVACQIAALMSEFLFKVLQIILISGLVGGVHHLSLRQGLRLQKPKNIKLFWMPIFAVVAYGVVALINSQQPNIDGIPIESLLSTTPAFILFMFFSITIGPIAEELTWRGFIYPALNRRYGIYTAVIITSLGHGLIHAPQLWGAWFSILAIVVVSIIATVIRAFTKSTLASIVFHLAYNFIVVIGVFLW